MTDRDAAPLASRLLERTPRRARVGFALGAVRCSSPSRPPPCSRLPARPARQVPVLRDRRGRHRPRLGPRRHAHPRPGRVLRPRRLRDGDAPEARRRRARATCPTSCSCTASRRAARGGGSRSPARVFALAADGAAADAGRLRCSARWSSAAGCAARTSRSSARRSPRPSRSCSSASRAPPAAPTASPTSRASSATTSTTRSTSGWSTSSSPARCWLLLALARQLMHSRYGELLVAVRDSEERVRFLGYDPANVKLVAYVVAAGMAGLAGALFVPAVGIISPGADRDRAVDRVRHRRRGRRPGQRCSGAVLGAVAVAWAQDRAVRAVPGRLDVLPGAAVRRRGGVPARRPGLAGGDSPRAAAPAGAGPEHASTEAVRRGPDPNRTGGRTGEGAAAMTDEHLRRACEIRDLRVVVRRLHRRRRRRPATCGPRRPAVPHRARTAPARRRWSTRSPGWSRPPARSGSASSELLGPDGAPDRPARHRPHLPDRDRLRGADRAAEPRHRRGRRARLVRPCCAAAAACPTRSHEALETIGPDRAARPRRGHARARPEAVAGDRHAAGAERAAAAARRAGRRHEPRGARGHRRAARRRSPRTAPSSSSSTTWTSCAASPAGSPCCTRQGAQRGHGRRGPGRPEGPGGLPRATRRRRAGAQRPAEA